MTVFLGHSVYQTCTIRWQLRRTCIVLRHADNRIKHVQYHVIPTTALDIYSTAIYRQPPQKITKLCHTNAMWYVTSRTISVSIASIHIRQMSLHRQSSTRQTYSVVVTNTWKDGQIDWNATLCGLYLCSITRLPQYTIIFSHCPTTAVRQHTTERRIAPYLSLSIECGMWPVDWHVWTPIDVRVAMTNCNGGPWSLIACCVWVLWNCRFTWLGWYSMI